MGDIKPHKRAVIVASTHDEDNIPIESIDDDRVYSGKFPLRLPKLLHKNLYEEAEIEKVSLNQLMLYKLAKLDGVVIPIRIIESTDIGYSEKIALRIPISLHKNIAIEARTQKISMNKLIVCKLAKT